MNKDIQKWKKDESLNQTSSNCFVFNQTCALIIITENVLCCLVTGQLAACKNRQLVSEIEGVIQKEEKPCHRLQREQRAARLLLA